MNHPVAKDCVMPMGWTSEAVSKEFNITRERMDDLAAQSHQRAYAAQKSGKFEAEILPIKTLLAPSTPSATGGAKAARVASMATADDGIRGDSSKEGLAKVIFPPFRSTLMTHAKSSISL